MASVLPVVVGIYAGLGLAIAIPFIIVGIQRTTEAARDSSPIFRLLVLPGAVALWPIVLKEWSATRSTS